MRSQWHSLKKSWIRGESIDIKILDNNLIDYKQDMLCTHNEILSLFKTKILSYPTRLRTLC
jgi:hypothetical protein